MSRVGMDDLLALTPTEFERLVCALCVFWGYRDVWHTGGGGDLAADIVCSDRWAERTVVQCKRYLPGKLVKSPEIQTFIGMVHVHHDAEHGVYVTTSGYTEPALQLGRRHGIRLVDGSQLLEHLQRFQVAVAQRYR